MLPEGWMCCTYNLGGILVDVYLYMLRYMTSRLGQSCTNSSLSIPSSPAWGVESKMLPEGWI